MYNSSIPRMVMTALLGLSISRSVFALNYGFPYGHQKVRGVNLGGWLILSPWVTPSLFEGTDSRVTDEWTFNQYQNKTKARQVLSHHWDTFITERDFADIAEAGLNHVRLPIGYWAFEVAPGEPYLQGQLPYLNKAVEWAKKYNLKLIVDLHGAPGSQNGFINSGQKRDSPGWHTQQSYVNRTNAIIRKLAAQFKDMTDVVPTIEALNEPAGFFGEDILNVTKQYWYDSYDSIRYPYYAPSKKSNTVVMIHDTFKPLSYWKDFMPYPKFEGVAMDTHIHQIFSNEAVALSEEQHIQGICGLASNLTNAPLWTIVAEWSPSATDCAKDLNGRGVGARYDGSFPGSSRVGSCDGKSGNASTFSESYKTFLRRFWEAQAITFEKAQGWIQFTWKAESADDWSYQAGLKYGWIPRNPADRQYPDVCE